MILVLLLASALAASPARAATTAPVPGTSPDPRTAPLRGIGVEETLDAGPVLAPALAQAHTPAAVPVYVRLTVTPREVAGDATVREAALDERLALYAGSKVPVVLALGGLPATADVETWKAQLRDLASRVR